MEIFSNGKPKWGRLLIGRSIPKRDPKYGISVNFNHKQTFTDTNPSSNFKGNPKEKKAVSKAHFIQKCFKRLFFVALLFFCVFVCLFVALFYFVFLLQKSNTIQACILTITSYRKISDKKWRRLFFFFFRNLSNTLQQ